MIEQKKSFLAQGWEIIKKTSQDNTLYLISGALGAVSIYQSFSAEIARINYNQLIQERGSYPYEYSWRRENLLDQLRIQRVASVFVSAVALTGAVGFLLEAKDKKS